MRSLASRWIALQISSDHQSSTPEQTSPSGQQERSGRYKARFIGVEDRFEMMGRTLQNPLGSSGLRNLVVETGKNWFWISWETPLFWIYAIKFHYRNRKDCACLFIYDFVYKILLGLLNLAIELEKDFHFDVLYSYV